MKKKIDKHKKTKKIIIQNTQQRFLQPKIRPVNCSCWGGNLFIQNPALELVILEEQEKQLEDKSELQG